MSSIGYIRVSTEHQETARQETLMKQYKVERIFGEKMSGKNANRPELKNMLDYVRDGDTLYIESISRLGRSTRDLLNIIDVLQSKGVLCCRYSQHSLSLNVSRLYSDSVRASLLQNRRESTKVDSLFLSTG